MSVPPITLPVSELAETGAPSRTNSVERSWYAGRSTGATFDASSKACVTGRTTVTDTATAPREQRFWPPGPP